MTRLRIFFFPAFSWFILITMVLYFPVFGLAQGPDNKKEITNIRVLMQAKKWSEVEKAAEEKLADIYARRLERSVPTNYISEAIRRQEKREKALIVRRKPRSKVENQLIEQNQEIYELHLSLAFAKLNLNKHYQAIANFREAKRYILISPEMKKDLAFIEYQIALSYRAMKQSIGYEESLERAIAMDPVNPLYHRLLALSYQYRKPERASYLIEEYLAKRSAKQKEKDLKEQKTESIYLILSGLYERRGRYLDALKYYQEYLVAHPQDGEVAFAAGVIAQDKLGQFNKALQLYSQAMEHIRQEDYKRRFVIHARVAEIFSLSGEYDKAIENYEQTKPYYQEINKEITDVYEKINEIKNKMNELKANILRKNDQQSQSILDSYNTRLAEENKRIDKARQLQSGYNIGKIEWSIAENYARLGQKQKSIEQYQKALEHGYRQEEAHEQIRRLSPK